MTRKTKTHTRVYDTDKLEIIQKERTLASARGHKYFKSEVPERFNERNSHPWRTTSSGSVVLAKVVPRKIKEWWRDGCKVDAKATAQYKKELAKSVRRLENKFNVEVAIK